MVQFILEIDEDIKIDAEEVCKELGFSLSEVITIFLKKLGREHKI